MAIVSISGSTTGKNPEPGEGEHVGSFLRRAREERALTLADVSAAIKVPRSSLEQLERGAFSSLPAEVFVRGFIRSYARVVGVTETEPLALYDRALKAHDEATRVEAARPVVDPVIAGIATDEEREGMAPRRGLGLAVFVIILLLIATITLSLLLRRPPQSGEGLSGAPLPLPATSTGSTTA
jgi:cytoskeletal protein RodZ